MKDSEVPTTIQVSPPDVEVVADSLTQQVNQDLLENSRNLKPFSEDRSEDNFEDEISVSLKKVDLKNPSQGPQRYAKQNTPK